MCDQSINLLELTNTKYMTFGDFEMYSLAVVIMAIVAACANQTKALDAQDHEHDVYQALFCSQDSTTKASLVECMKLMPSSHYDIIKACDPKVADFIDDHGKMIDYICHEEESALKTSECIDKTYEEQNQDEMQVLKEALECMQSLLSP